MTGVATQARPPPGKTAHKAHCSIAARPTVGADGCLLRCAAVLSCLLQGAGYAFDEWVTAYTLSYARSAADTRNESEHTMRPTTRAYAYSRSYR